MPTWEKQASYERFVHLFIHIDEANDGANDGASDQEIVSSNTEHRDNFHKIGMIPSVDSSAEHPNVEMIEIHNPSRTTQVEKCIQNVCDEAADAFEDNQEKTFIHVVYRGPATTEEGKIVIKCTNGQEYPLE